MPGKEALKGGALQLPEVRIAPQRGKVRKSCLHKQPSFTQHLCMQPQDTRDAYTNAVYLVEPALWAFLIQCSPARTHHVYIFSIMRLSGLCPPW